MENVRNGAGLLVVAVLALLLRTWIDDHYGAMVLTIALVICSVLGLVLIALGLFRREGQANSSTSGGS